MHWELITPVILTAFGLSGGIWYRRRRIRRSAPAIPVEKRSEMLAGLRASLIELRRQLEEDPFRGKECNQRTKVLILHRCGMPIVEIADHLGLPEGEVDLIVELAQINNSQLEPDPAHS
jgi:hypothetical protein